MRVGHESLYSLPASAKLRPLRDQIIVEPIDWNPSSFIEVVYSGRPVQGRVLAIGPGTYPKRYNGAKGARTKSWDSCVFRPTEVKVGDLVQLGGLEIQGYLFTAFRWGDREVIVCREEDVAGVT